MKRFEDFVDGLNEDVKIPDTVEQKFEKTLSNLEVNERKHSFKWMKIGSIAAFFMVGGVLLALNPTMVSNIPIIGNIFEMIEDKIDYAGDYSNKQILSEKETSKDIFTIEDKDIKITASEVYSDGFSVFVTMKMDSTKYDFSKINSYVETGGKGINVAISYGINSEVGGYDYDFGFEGDNVGKNTFIGMLKFDKTDYSLEDGYINIEIKSIYIDDPDKLVDRISVIEGSWKLKIPYETDKESGKLIDVEQKTDTDLTVKKLFISPYQLVVLCDVPYTMPYANMSDAELKDKFGKTDDQTLEDIRKNKHYAFYEMAVFDQDGNPLDGGFVGTTEGDLQGTNYSLRGKDVYKVHIYISQNEDDVFELIKAKTEKKAKSLSEYDFVVDIK